MLTGDSFFVDSVGRPDLLGDEETEELTEALFRTTQDFYMKLPDGVIIYPCHGAGSACGPNIGDRMSSTIGYERAHNKYAAITDLDAFKRALTENAPPVSDALPAPEEGQRRGTGGAGKSAARCRAWRQTPSPRRSRRKACSCSTFATCCRSAAATLPAR